MSNEVYTSTIAGDDKDKSLAEPLVHKDPLTTDLPPTESCEPDLLLEVTEDTECGIGFIRGRLLQKLANKNVYVLVHSLAVLVQIAAWSYSSAAISTMEKRFKIPSKTIGIIAIGNDITQLCVSLSLSYYAGKGHRPRWVAFGLFTVVCQCILQVLPHFIFGPGQDALSLTKEFGQNYSNVSGPGKIMDKELKKLCIPNAEGFLCDESKSHTPAIIMLFSASLVSGIGGSLLHTIGTSYMDDNIPKKKTAAFISGSWLLKLPGPALGYAVASYCLSIFISPALTPTIDNEDPRWLGAWWIGWLVFGSLLTLLGSIIAMFPKVLPKAAARKAAAEKIAKLKGPIEAEKVPEAERETRRSFSDMIKTFKRLLKNPILLCNVAAGVFYVFGYEPYWVFMAKYIETQYRKSASDAALVTGNLSLVFSAAGISLAGFVITKYRPTARQMALWNVCVGLISVICIASYTLVGCSANNIFGEVTKEGELRTQFTCNTQCDCEYVPYSPICASDGKATFISACHAGCTNFTLDDKGSKTYTNCSCIPPDDADPDILANWTLSSSGWTSGGWAKPGSCPVECGKSFFAFLAVVSLLKFCGATGRATNFLVAVRCVAAKDKPVAMALESTVLSIFAFMPSLIFYGQLMDMTCLVWGKTCSGTGNCWLYNNESLRYMLNLSAAALILIGTMFDLGVWHNVKNLKIYDDGDGNGCEQGKSKEMTIIEKKRKESLEIIKECTQKNGEL